MLRVKVGREDCWALWSADDGDRQVILEAKSPAQPVTIGYVGQHSSVTPWGFRDWAGRRGEFIPNRLSVVVGHRPVLIGNDLSGVSVHLVIPRPRTPAGQEQGR